VRPPCAIEDWPIFDNDVGPEQADEALLSLGVADGLPVVAPTRGRLDAMLAGRSGADEPHDVVPPLRRALTLRRVAYNCVLAGCDPSWLDVTFSAVAACLEPAFNLVALQSTTGTAAVAVVLHGAAVTVTGANAGANALGPGSAANARIGRAVALALRNVGGAAPGTIDMATIGQPGKYTFCFAEHADVPPLVPLHVRRGLPLGAAAVTVIGVSGTTEVVPRATDTAAPVLEIIGRSMQILGGLDPSGSRFGGGEQFVLVPPEICALFARESRTLDALQREIFTAGTAAAAALPEQFRATPAGDDVDSVVPAESPAEIHLVATGGIGIKITLLPGWMGGTRSVTRPVVSV
jgi:hypothetical protein